MFDTATDVFMQKDIEAATDCVVWCTTGADTVKPARTGDRAARGEIGDILLRYAHGELGGPAPIPLPQVNRLHVVGDTALTRRLKELRRGELGKYLAGLTDSTCAVHGMMQCMLKGVCSQCLQWQIDPATGKRTKAVFACSWQDEPMDIVDLDNLDERQAQNRLQERLTGLWLDYLLARHPVERI